MGLDVDFYDGKSRKHILELRNPDTFFEMLAAGESDLVDDIHTDFWVGESQLLGTAVELVCQGATSPTTPEDFLIFVELRDKAVGFRADELDRQTDLNCSLLITAALTYYVRDNGPIICSWSA